MKDAAKSFLAFSKAERYGLAGLLLVLLFLIILKATLPYFISPQADTKQEQQLLAKWQAIQSKNASAGQQQTLPAQYAAAPQLPAPKAAGATSVAQTDPFYFDPNTLDSAGFRRLGLREKTTSILLHWRDRGKIFRQKDELRKVYTLTEAEYLRLEPYIQIEAPKLQLNAADSAQLVKLRGIGPALAHRIVEYRREHGHFTQYSQLQQLCRFPDSVFVRLQQELAL